MPLDTGDVEIRALADAAGDELASLRPAAVSVAGGEHLGAALAAARRSLDLAIEDIASATRVRASHLAAIEAYDFDSLPARPFVVGYVRAYARALGLDADAVVARFRAEAPGVSNELRAPVGLERTPPLAPRLIGIVTAVILTAVIGWNIWRHAEARPLRAQAAASEVVAPTIGPMSVGAPPPTPPEASSPPTYQTPGLPAPSASASPAAPVQGAAAPADGQGAPSRQPGAIYGAPAPGAGLILQARASTTLVVRGPGGSVTFAREMAAGEAWRAPGLEGLVVDAGSPSAVEVFVGGVSKGTLAAPQQALSKLAEG